MRGTGLALLALTAALVGGGAASARDLGPWGAAKRVEGALQAAWPATGAPTFLAYCDAGRRELVLDYRVGEDVERPAKEPPLAVIDDPTAEHPKVVEFRTRWPERRRMVGRAAVTPQLLAVLESPLMSIDAPNEIGEPWYFGRSEPLLEVARLCR